MAQDNIYFRGVPTEPDIQLLRHRWPEAEMKVGQIIAFDEICQTLHVKRESSRFATVTSRWRKLVERGTSNIILGSERGVGFRVLSNTQKLDLGGQKFAGAIKASRRPYEITGKLDLKTATEDEKSRAMFLQQRASAVLGVAQIRSGSGALPAITDGARP